MNTIRVIDFLLEFLPEPTGDMMLSAQNHLRSLVAQYDALAPDWSEAPDWAQWYTIDTDGTPLMHEDEPFTVAYNGVWRSNLLYKSTPGDFVILPLGLDWRLCKWQRTEVSE